MSQHAEPRAILCSAMLIAVLVLSYRCDAHAQPSRVRQIAIEYVAPKNELHSPIYERLKRERWLERMQQVLQRYRLQRAITVRLAGCDGSVDAWYLNRQLTVCYEYLQVVVRRIEANQLPAWVTAEQAMAGAFVDAVLHEFAHALIEQGLIPVLGREEDAADQLSAYTMLLLGGVHADGVIRGTAHVYLSWMEFFARRPQAKLPTGANRNEASAHPTAAQRLYNLVCIAYGARPEMFEPLATAIELPPSRKEDCDDEYAQVGRAYRALVARHVRPSREAAARQAFRFFTDKR